MLLSKITLNNFRSFVGKHEIVLDQRPGLFSIKGENLLDDIGSNGAGKSTVLDAIYYGLLGQTARGLKGENVKARGGKGIYGVRLEFNLDGKDYNLFRSRNPSHLMLNDTEIAQEGIDNLFDMPVDDMLKAMIMDQMPESLLSQTPAKRLETFEAVLGLAVWERAIKISRDNHKETETQVSFLQGKIAGLEQQIEASKGKAASLTEKRDGFEQERVRNMDALRKQKEETDKTVEALTKKANELTRKCEELGMQEGAASLPPADDRIGVVEGQLREAVASKASVIALGKQLKNSMKKAKDIIAQGKCPVCETVLTDCSIDWAAQDKTDEARLGELREEGRKIVAEEEELTKRLEELKAELKAREQKALEASRAFSTAEKEAATAKAELDRHASSVQGILDNLAKEKERTNPYNELISAEKASQIEASKECDDLSQQIADHESRLAANEFWVEGFKNIRLSAVEEALFALQAEANSVLHGLGMTSTRVAFATQRETQKKTTSRGFFIEIFVDEQQVPVGSFSGGELQRINIALSMAFGGLMRNSHGFFPMQEFYDEPTQGLSREGTRDLIQYLEQRARDNSTVVYLIDHKGPESIPNAFTVVKDQSGSHIQTL